MKVQQGKVSVTPLSIPKAMS